MRVFGGYSLDRAPLNPKYKRKEHHIPKGVEGNYIYKNKKKPPNIDPDPLHPGEYLIYGGGVTWRAKRIEGQRFLFKAVPYERYGPVVDNTPPSFVGQIWEIGHEIQKLGI